MSLALWAAAATGVQVGAAIVASRFAVGEVPPLTLAMLRYAIGFACLLPFAWRPLRVLAGPQRPPARDLGAMAALGIGQFGVLIALLNLGLRQVPAAPAALVFSLFPLLTLLLAAALGQERIHARLTGGVALSIAGVACCLAPGLGGWRPDAWGGVLAVLAAAATGALCSVLYRPYLRRYPVLPVSAFAMLASVGVLAVLAWPEHWPARLAGFSAPAWAAIVFVGVSSGVGYVAWLYALKHESATRVTVFLALNPLTASVLGWLALGERPATATWPALVLVAAGLGLATRRADNPRP
ncbi:MULTISPECIES: DMT family transporter [Ramlibacter]|uniref:EamA family transporter n=1 Tax=Ramlibacter pinisoli TaxID=2682844 RepID=A0A6N8IN80_9BURK|nr:MULTISPECIES: DMT family transporter [Ramlibacter]MBA2963174.1 DMT family transporter [Ramlibacter sp. CGMCC 1.13660]MVQ28142.1 EamA family transporter [Ramlibacter pinisoli]